MFYYYLISNLRHDETADALRITEWGVEKSKLIGTSAVKKQKREAMDVLQEVTFRYNPT